MQRFFCVVQQMSFRAILVVAFEQKEGHMGKNKIGIIDVGGGMRDIYGAGVLDYCMEENITFDLGIGVSAGSANLASFIARQKHRNLQFYTEYSFRKKYVSLWNFLRHRNMVDLDYVYSTLSNADGENPLDYPTLRDNPMDFIVVATEAETGRVHYFDKRAISQDRYDIFKASSAIPFFCRPYPIDGTLYYDGALSDPVPVERALAEGCDNVILILTLPESTVRTPERDQKAVDHIKEEFPNAATAFSLRYARYNAGVDMVKALREEGRALILSPDDTCGIDTLKRDKEGMRKLYEKGLKDAEKIAVFLGQEANQGEQIG